MFYVGNRVLHQVAIHLGWREVEALGEVGDVTIAERDFLIALCMASR